MTQEVKPKDFPVLPDYSLSPPYPITPYSHHPLFCRDMCHLTMPVRSHQGTEDVYMVYV
ncbi:hypothetical protein QUA20_22205 [Microcoleus sp. Pol7_A1]|uniref:hypothetical protein n=1 Tax=Microcoleus sp. Pol7_A1 TaxID=2818893 RepID=UPI002FD5297A